MTALRAKKLTLLLGLDAFGDGAQSELPCHEKNRGDDRSVIASLCDSSDETTVDLDGVDRKLLEVTERRLPGAEIIDSDRDFHVAQAVQNASASFTLADCNAFRQLHFQQTRIETGHRQDSLNHPDKVALVQLPRRDIDCNPRHIQAPRLPLH